MIKKVHVFLLISFFISLLSQAQYYSSGSDPASIKWRQINTEHFKVVFPSEYEKEARRLTAIFEKIYLFGGYTLGHSPKRIDVLIHSRSAYSNGFVSWAPKRIELYPTADQDVFAMDYLEQLAIHEFRHVVQIDKLNTGFTKALSVIAGQQAIGAVLGLYIPMWFLEGDAVMTETMLSNSGRGRLPSFEQEMKAQLLEKKLYSYDKAGLGSYHDYVPNHYIMGYHFVAGARSKYGKDVWEEALENTGEKSWSITPFNHGIKKVTGQNKTTLYKNVFDDWRDLWLKKDSSTTFTTFKYYTERDPHYVNYLYPKFINDTTIITQVSGPGEITRFVTINTETKQEKRLHIPGYHERAPYSLSAEKLVWAELESHLRWENADWSNIWIYDFEKGNARRLTHSKRFFEFLTNNFDITAEEVAFLYKKRWGIELLFKKMKQNFQLHYFYGENENAIRTQVWCTLIAQLLMTVIQKVAQTKKAFSVVASLVRIHLISMLDMVELLRSTSRAYKVQVGEPPGQLQLKLM